MKLLVKRLLPIVEERMQNKNMQGSKPVLAASEVDVTLLIAEDGYSPMDDRLVATVRSLVGNKDCTGHPGPLVWIYPPARNGELCFACQSCLIFTYWTPQAIVYALYDLCRHPEYIETLREEIKQHSKEEAAGDYYEHMYRLDSFLKESARFSPSDSSRSILPEPLSMPFPSE